MKIKIFSDIHLEHFYSKESFSVGSGEVLILAGDILTAKGFKTTGLLNKTYKHFLNSCSENYQTVLYVLGNHEHYGYCFDHTANKIKENLPNNIYLLDNDKFVIGNWIFLGSTFWTDFRNENPLDMLWAHMNMNDYKSIRITNTYRKLNPNDILSQHKISKHYFNTQLEFYKNYNVFIISHMAPSYRSISEQYMGDDLNSSFANSLGEWITDNPQIKYWIHGHCHNSSDYYIGECRIICNPYGYRGDNNEFNPNFEIDIDR